MSLAEAHSTPLPPHAEQNKTPHSEGNFLLPHNSKVVFQMIPAPKWALGKQLACSANNREQGRREKNVATFQEATSC